MLTLEYCTLPLIYFICLSTLAMLYELRVKCYNRKLVSPPNFNAPNKLRYNTIQHLLNTVCFLRYTLYFKKINLLSLNNYHGEGMRTITLLMEKF